MRRLTRLVHTIDHGLARLRPRRTVAVEIRTPVSAAILGPVYQRLEQMPDVNVCFTSEHPERIRPLLAGRRVLTHAEAEWQRFDLCLNADPWAAARLRRCASRVNFFHGVAGKYDLDRPKGLPMGFEYYDRVAFINRIAVFERVRRRVSDSHRHLDFKRGAAFVGRDDACGHRRDLGRRLHVVDVAARRVR